MKRGYLGITLESVHEEFAKVYGLAEAKGASDIGDRAEAIKAGISALQPGDVLLIAGKGHETGQIVGDKVLPFSDHEAVAAALAARVA